MFEKRSLLVTAGAGLGIVVFLAVAAIQISGSGAASRKPSVDELRDQLLSARTEPPVGRLAQPASTPASGSLSLVPRGKIIVRVFENQWGSRVSRPTCSDCKNALPAADATRCGFCRIALEPATALKCTNCAGNGRWQCSGCNGTGTVTESCLNCKGTGNVKVLQSFSDPDYKPGKVKTCYQCKGTGNVNRICYKCFGYERRVGKGYIECSYCGGRGTVN